VREVKKVSVGSREGEERMQNVEAATIDTESANLVLKRRGGKKGKNWKGNPGI